MRLRAHGFFTGSSLAAIALCSIVSLSSETMAQTPSQTPLTSRTSSVAPNVVFMFDDSASMPDDYLYQDTTSTAWGSTPSIGVNGVDAPASTETYAKCSPEINQIYYDPTVRFQAPYDNVGVRVANASTSVSWGGNVCKDGSGNPLLYHYFGPGPRYDGSHRLDLASSYPTTVTIKSGLTYTKTAGRTDCSGATCTYTEELQNFANWYKWYRTRLEMAKNASIEAFNDLPASFRLGWGKINTLGGTSKVLNEGVSTFNAAKRTAFVDFINGITSTVTATPNRTALDTVGKYYQRTDGDGPWGTTPNRSSTGISTVASPTNVEAANKMASCRRANAILITDGYYNDSFSGVGDVDGVNGPTISRPSGGTFQYTPANPYKQNGASNTFADVAMKYWVNDLNSSIPNSVPVVPGLDNAFWQHLNFWAIGLGIDGTLAQNATTLANLTSGSTSWPSPTGNSASAIDDMWHATINGRGGMLNAGNPAQLVTSLNSMLGQILKASSSQAGVAVSTVNLTSGTVKFVPAYTSGEWTGNVIANNLDATTGNETSIRWQAEIRDPVTGIETNNTLYPDLSVAFGSRSQVNRNIVVGRAYNAAGSAVAFTYPVMAAEGSPSLASTITPAFTGQTVDSVLIDYLRGDRSQESSTSTRNYRPRMSLLGDIVNSTPTFVKPAYDYGYTVMPASASAASGAYAAYLTTKAARSEGALFVGANDGMLHVFGENDGREIFAFVPRSVLPNIAKLADPSYPTPSHQYFVDGPLIQSDYYDGSNWKNVVVGTTGAGAKAVFALDATTPTSMSAAKVKWEINPATSSNHAELGYVLSDVRVGLMRNGQWAAVFGNGVASASGTARLFVVSMTDGSVIRVIDTKAGPSNGLGGVRLVFNDKNEVIGAYGGDLLGDMWRFDLSDATPANWSTTYGTTTAPVPLYKAKNSAGAAQAITAAPFVMTHPSGGYLVAFGTGKFFEDSDLGSTGTQSAYGIRDKQAFNGAVASPNPTGSKVAGTSTLVLQTISTEITANRTVTAFDNSTSTMSVTYYSVSSNAIDWTAKDGWYFDMPNSGQRTVFPVDSIFNRIVRVDTIVPGQSSADPCTSQSTGTGYNYIIDALNGGSPVSSTDGADLTIMDTNGDGVVNASDVAGVSGYTTAADGRDISVLRLDSTKTASYNSTVTSLAWLADSHAATSGSTSSSTTGLTTADTVDVKTLSSLGDAATTKFDICKIISCSSPSSSKKIIKRSWRQLFLR